MNEIVETEDHNDKEEEYYSEKDTEESETSESDEINNIDLIYEVLDVNQNLTQDGTSDTSLKNKKIPNCIEPNQKKEWDIQLER
ncbi:hypothetical protein O181_055398 [Austropuccinia psidii MF-1]|uniref:Uncharacterized protein n=1 Tax=Austropuccinia psidii MF-1 TaxID=1389203 RepID=A0A9Q3EB34_9BASI|nr:hypothetical protein [Austropuccinia psidii MF-1]